MPVAHLNDTELFYVEVGEGLPCLVMHGGLGFDRSALHPWLDRLSDVMHLVYYDHRGNGRSGRPPSGTITFEQLCADADALREHLGFEKVAILGHSFGGFVALEYALRYPERITRLILLDTASTLDYGEEIEANAKRKGATQEQLEALDASAEDEAESWRLWKVIESPLTGQAVGAWLVGVGVTAAHMCWENDFGHVYAAMAGYAALGALQLLALARYGGATVDWSGAGGWIYLLFVLSVFGVGLYGWLEARRRTGRFSIRG